MLFVKKYNPEWKVEFSSEELTSPYKNRYLFYRIVPSELPLINRIFCNEWHKLYHSYSCINGRDFLFDVNEYYELIKPLKTLGEVKNFLRKQEQLCCRFAEDDGPVKRWDC